MRPLCVNCQRDMTRTESGVVILEYAKALGPYQLWHADLFVCPSCETQVVADKADRPYARHGQADFDEKVAFILGQDKVKVFKSLEYGMENFPALTVRQKHKQLVLDLEDLVKRWQGEANDDMPLLTAEILSECARKLHNRLDQEDQDPAIKQ